MEVKQEAPLRLGPRPALDGLRGVAVALVVGIHVGLLEAGYVGVDLFLPLSGFLITTLLCEEWERRGTISLPQFYARRARRLLPALLLLVSVFALMIIVLHPFATEWPLGKLLAATLLFVNNWLTSFMAGHGQVLGALSPTWTLAQEVQFYLLWPPTLILLLRLRLRPRTLLAVLFAAIVLLLASSSLIEHLDGNFNAYTSPFNRVGELLFGAAAAIVWRERLTPRLLRAPMAGWLCVAGLGGLVLMSTPSTTFWYMTAALFSTFLVLNLLAEPDGEEVPSGRPWIPARARRALGSALASRPLTYTGKISYGIYLFHVPIYYVLWSYLPTWPPALYWPAVLTLSFLAAALSWELVETRIPHKMPRRPGTSRRGPSMAHHAGGV